VLDNFEQVLPPPRRSMISSMCVQT
jgi:hypothetical protein